MDSFVGTDFANKIECTPREQCAVPKFYECFRCWAGQLLPAGPAKARKTNPSTLYRSRIQNGEKKESLDSKTMHMSLERDGNGKQSPTRDPFPCRHVFSIGGRREETNEGMSLKMASLTRHSWLCRATVQPITALQSAIESSLLQHPPSSLLVQNRVVFFASKYKYHQIKLVPGYSSLSSSNTQKSPSHLMQLSVRGNGKTAKLALEPDDPSVAELLLAIERELGICTSRQVWRAGFPPKVLDTANVSTVKAAGIQNRDVVTVAESEAPLRERIGTTGYPAAEQAPAGPPPGGAATASSSAAPQHKNAGASATPSAVVPALLQATDGVERHIIAADNSCLFNSILWNFGPRHPKTRTQTGTTMTPQALRGVCAQEIRGDPSKWDMLTLAECDKPSLEYADWISKSDSWGGFLEMMILSNYFQTQIAAVDIRTARLEYFPHLEGLEPAEREKYKDRMFVYYDGIHYDACARKTGVGNNDGLVSGNGLFAVQDDVALTQVVAAAIELKEQKQFTVTATFTLQCQHCFKLLTGEKEAQGHAKETGHFNFQEAPGS
ncbi:unnamed protein product [Amoebophrya sp. A120]|nr:unnamed protein product [Amoebophrya sp. A120]|eukprot:GSA120T00001855001.1